MNKERFANQAIEHTELMNKTYGEWIKKSYKFSKIYTETTPSKRSFSRQHKIPLIEVNSKDTVTSIFDERNKIANIIYKKFAALNFASYTTPGGGFLAGSHAQEECLCQESTLYNVLVKQKKFYNMNNSDINKALYKNNLLYTPNIIFHRADAVFCDVITCAAPNYSAAQALYNVTDEENSLVLKSRIHHILQAAENEHVDILILGAFGCGVFGQNPREVADIFYQELLSGKYGFSKVVFSILPVPDSYNLASFKEIFE